MEINRGGDQTRVTMDDSEFATDMARRICTEYIPRFMMTFIVKNRKYRKVTNNLGAKGVFPDINRKVGIIEARVWDGDGEPDVGQGESTIEVIDDLIGHLLIMRDMLLIDEGEKSEGPSIIERQNDGHIHQWDSLSNCIHCGKPGVGRLNETQNPAERARIVSALHTADLLPDVLDDHRLAMQDDIGEAYARRGRDSQGKPIHIGDLLPDTLSRLADIDAADDDD